MKENMFWSVAEQAEADVRAVTLVLDAERAQRHSYDGKFVACESMATSLAACGASVMVEDGALRAALAEATAGRVVLLCLEGWQKCDFVAKEEERVEEPVRVESEILGARISEAVTVTRYRWRLEAAVEMFVLVGMEKRVVWKREGCCDIATAENNAPRKTKLIGPLTTEASFVFGGKALVIDRESPQCRTPRRNPQMEAVLSCCEKLGKWAAEVARALERLRQVPFGVETMSRPESWHLPVVPLLNGELVESVVSRFQSMWSGWGSREQRELESAGVLAEMVSLFFRSVADVEKMLHDQLVAAIGTSRVTRADLEHHMRLRIEQVFGNDAVRPLCRSVRRDSESDPEAMVVIGERDNADGWLTMQGPSKECDSVEFPISAATVVRCTPELHVHGATLFDVGGEPSREATVTVRTRQFGMCIVVLGRLEPKNRLVPEHSVIVQSRQTLEIPLRLEVLPSQGEFRDAVASMSREQRDFAQAFRAMQLSSTAFAVLVVQVKPQLERAMSVGRHVMTRELALARSVLELLVEYGIPPSLLRARETGTVEELLQNVSEMQKMIAEMKKALIGNVPAETEAEVPRVGGPLMCYSLFPHDLPAFVPDVFDEWSYVPVKKKKLISLKRTLPRLSPADEVMRQEMRYLARLVRLVVMGLPQSGKSTLMKQTRLLYGNRFSAEEMEEFRQVCIHNALSRATLYFEEHAQRVLADGFLPNDEDVLNCRARSIGVRDVEWKFDGSLLMRMTEATHKPAGSGRKSLLCQFEEVTAVLYVVDTRSYDKLRDALADFDGIINSKWLQNTNVFLLLNVGEKECGGALSDVWPEFVGGTLYDELEYIRHRFVEKNGGRGRYVDAHVVNALDTKDVGRVLQVVKDTLIRRAMRGGGCSESSWSAPFPRPDVNKNQPLLVMPTARVVRAKVAPGNVATETKGEESTATKSSVSAVSSADISSIGHAMNDLFDRSGSSLRQTVLHVESKWRRQESGFVGAAKSVELGKDEIAAERNTCFGLLDSLSNGGCLSLGSEAELHVVFVATHQYEKSVLDSVVQESRDPIEELQHDWSLMREAICAEKHFAQFRK